MAPRRKTPPHAPRPAPAWRPAPVQARGEWVGPLRQIVQDASGSSGRVGWKIVAQERRGLDGAHVWRVSPVFLPPAEVAAKYYPDNYRWQGEPLPFASAADFQGVRATMYYNDGPEPEALIREEDERLNRPLYSPAEWAAHVAKRDAAKASGAQCPTCGRCAS